MTRPFACHGLASAVTRSATRTENHGHAHVGQLGTRGLGGGARLHGHQPVVRALPRPRLHGRLPARGRRPRRHPLRHRGGLRALRQRGGRRRRPGAGARRGRAGHQVRLRLRRPGPPGRRLQPTREHPPCRGGLPAAAAHRLDRPALPAPRRSRHPDRGRGGHGQGARRRGQGAPLRHLRGRRADHPPRTRRLPGDRAAERVLPVLARAGAGPPGSAGGARHRLRPVQPPRARVPHRDRRRVDGVRRRRHPLDPPPLHGRGPRGQPGTRGPGRRGRRGASARPRARSRWRGCSRSAPGSCRSRAPAGSRGSRRTSAPPTYTSPRTTWPASTRRPPRCAIVGERYPEAMQRLIDR